jgi:hypothetical protein
MHEVYHQLFHHQYLENGISISFENENKIKSFLDKQRSTFQQLITSQRISVLNASIEPTFFWFKNEFSSSRYNLIVQQQIDLFRILHNIDAAVSFISNKIQHCFGLFFLLKLIDLSEYSIKNENELIPNVHNELFDLSKQLNNCLQIWSDYFQLTQTRCYQLTRGFIPHRTQIIQTDLIKYEKCLSQLHKTIHRLQNEHQQGINRLFDHYFIRLNQGEKLTTFIPYAQNQQADFILLALSAMYYSITQLAHAALELGTTIHEVFELETTDLYQTF